MPCVVLQVAGAVLGVERVHLERRRVDQMARADELVEHPMVAQHVADVLAQEALDALPELLHALDVRLRHPPRAVGRVGRPRLEALDAFFARKFHETSVTRSLIGGNARIGSTVTGVDRSSWFSRVMHISRGLPLTSAEHDPHFPALQFQRTARSLACSA